MCTRREAASSGGNSSSSSVSLAGMGLPHRAQLAPTPIPPHMALGAWSGIRPAWIAPRAFSRSVGSSVPSRGGSTPCVPVPSRAPDTPEERHRNEPGLPEPRNFAGCTRGAGPAGPVVWQRAAREIATRLGFALVPGHAAAGGRELAGSGIHVSMQHEAGALILRPFSPGRTLEDSPVRDARADAGDHGSSVIEARSLAMQRSRPRVARNISI